MAGMRRRVSSRRGVLFGAAIAILLSASSVWAQDKVQINFAKAKELNQVKLDARSAPAKVTTEDETALVSKGYVMIGSFVVWQDGKKTAELVQALNSAALAKAAEAGGDLVRFTYKEGTITETEVPTDKVKKVCVETQSVPSSRYYCVPDPGHNSPICRMVDTTVCKKWEQQRQKKKVKALGNSGTVWRYDPKLLAELVERRAATERAEPQQARASGTAAGAGERNRSRRLGNNFLSKSDGSVLETTAERRCRHRNESEGSWRCRRRDSDPRGRVAFPPRGRTRLGVCHSVCRPHEIQVVQI